MTALPPRKHMSLRVKLDACLDALGLLGEAIQWDHDPALGLRKQIKNDAGEIIGYIPDENDPRYIRPKLVEQHAVKTNGRNHIKVGSDKGEIARLKRLEKAQAALRAVMADKEAARKANAEKRAKSRFGSRKFQSRVKT